MSNEQDLALPREETQEPAASVRATAQMQELWLLLAKRDWTTLVVLPVDAAGSARDVACSLADAGTSLSHHPVSAVTASEIEAGSARAIVALAQQLSGRQKRLWHKNDVIDVVVEPFHDSPQDDGFQVEPFGQLIISVPSVSAEPVALAVAHAADLVVLGVELGKTKIKDLERSIDLIGRERIGGCILI